MNALEEVSDPTDWLNTPVASLGAVEAGLRCHICKDFFDAPVITACSHTFCSACIRRSLSAVNAQKKCPLCWSQFDERQLRRNTTVEDLVRAFKTSRPDILKLGRYSLEGNRSVENSKGRKRKREQSFDSAEGPSPRKTRSHSKRAIVIQSSASPEVEESIEDGDQRAGEFQAVDGLAACPICQQRMPESQVFTHLDTHGDGEIIKDKKQGAVSILSTLPSRSQTSVPDMKPLPTITYHLLSETQLRKKMGELGISAAGPKQTMVRRHTEWRNLVNANCDSSSPKSKRELLQDLRDWERAQGGGKTNGTWKPNKTSTVMEKDFDRSAWSQSHGNDFRDLIAQARSKAKKVAENDRPQPQGPNDPNQSKTDISDQAPSMLRPEQTPEDLPLSSWNPASLLQHNSLDQASSVTEDPQVVRS